MIVCGGFGRLHLFQAVDFENIKIKILESASTNLGQTIKVLSTPITLEDFQIQRFGKYRYLETYCCNFKNFKIVIKYVYKLLYF